MITKNLNSLKNAEKVRFEKTADGYLFVYAHRGGALLKTMYDGVGEYGREYMLEIPASVIPDNVIEVIPEKYEFVLIGDESVRLVSNNTATFGSPYWNPEFVADLKTPIVRDAVARLNGDVTEIACAGGFLKIGDVQYPANNLEFSGTARVRTDLLKWAVENLDGNGVAIYMQDGGLLLSGRHTEVFVPPAE